MYLELGFTKQAGILDKITKGIDKIHSNAASYTEKAKDIFSKTRATADDIASRAGYISKKTVADMAAAHEEYVGKLTKDVELARAGVKPKKKNVGFMVGGAVGTVAGMGVSSLFNNKKRNSPYYPS